MTIDLDSSAASGVSIADYQSSDGSRAQAHLRLVSFVLCPYVQRAAIVAAEKKLKVEQIFIDLKSKPAWFVELSPTGKVPMLLVEDEVLFESAVIAEYLDESSAGSLLPDKPLERARHRAWVEFASATLADIAGLYSAADADGFEQKRVSLSGRFERVEREFRGPWFGDESFGLVDAAFAPVMRYLDAFESHASISLLEGLPNVQDWRQLLSERPSVIAAVQPNFPDRLLQFLRERGSYLSSLVGES